MIHLCACGSARFRTSRECRACAIRRRWPTLVATFARGREFGNRQRARTKLAVCRLCGVSFRPKKAIYSTFCTRAHYFAYKHERSDQTRPTREAAKKQRAAEWRAKYKAEREAQRIAARVPCRICGLPAIAVYCSPTCRREAGRIQSRIAARARRSPHRFSCLVCGVEGWTTRRRRLCCSFRCTRIYQRIREDMGWTGPDPLPHDFVKAKRAYGLAVWFLSDRRAFLASHPDPLDPLRALGAVPPNRQISP